MTAGRTSRRLAWLVTSALVVASCASDTTPEPSLNAFCERLGALTGLDELLDLLETGQLDGVADDLEELAAVAPPEIAPHVQVVVDYTVVVVEELEAIDPGDLRGASEVFRRHEAGVADVETAGTAVEVYAYELCGLALVDPAAGPTTSTTTSTTTVAATHDEPTTTIESPHAEPASVDPS